MEILLTGIAGMLVLCGSLFPLAVAVSFFKERDAVSRLNALGPATALGLPLIVVGSFIGWTAETGFSGWMLAKAIFTVTALILVSSVASNVLARAAYLSGAPLDLRTSPNDLAVDPETAE